MNTKRVDLLHAWFGMTLGEGGELEPRIIRVQPSSPTLKARISKPDAEKLQKLAASLDTAREEVAGLIQEAAKELGIGTKK